MKRINWLPWLTVGLVWLVGCGTTPEPQAEIELTAVVAQLPTVVPTALLPTETAVLPEATATITMTPTPTVTPEPPPNTATPESTPRPLATFESSQSGLTGKIYFLWDENLLPPPDERGIGEIAQTRLYEVVLDVPSIQSAFGEYGKPRLRPAPDSTQLAMTQSFDEDNDKQIDMVSLHAYQVLDGIVTQLTNDNISRIAFNWSPTSNSLVYSKGAAVWLLTLKGMTIERIAELPDSITQMAWSPQQDYLAVNRFPNHLDLIDLQDGHVINLLNDVDYASNFAWSADGNWLYVSSQSGRNLSLINIESNMMLPIVEDESQCNSSWLPTATQLAYTCDNTLYLWSADSQAIVELLSQEALGHPVWSPDGKIIAASFNKDGQSGLLFVNPQDGAQTELLLDLSPQQVVWSPDGTWLLLFVTGQTQEGLLVVEKESGQQFWLQETTGTSAPYDIFWLPTVGKVGE